MTATRHTRTDDLLAALGARTTVVTPNRRLSRELRQRHHALRKDAGASAWETPDILPLEPWLARQWKSLRDQRRDPRLLVNEVQRRKLWERLIARDVAESHPESAPLWHVPSAAENALQAWTIAHEWDMDLEHCRRSTVEDHQRFARWCEQYVRACEHEGRLDPAQLVDGIIAASAADTFAPDAQLVFAGFDTPAPAHRRLASHLSGLGVDVVMAAIQSVPDPVEVEYRCYDDDYAQWLAAAHWAREILERDPGARVGVIIPDLATTSQRVEYAFNQILNPAILFDAAAQGEAPHLSVGKTLPDYPVVRHALAWLRLCADRNVSSQALCEFILSPFMAGSAAEKNQRIALERQCRGWLPWEMPVNGLRARLERRRAFEHTPKLGHILDVLEQARADGNKTRRYGEWADLAGRWLEQSGWPGEQSPDSRDYQAALAFMEQLRQSRSLDAVSSAASLRGYVDELERSVRPRAFQPETAAARVEIMGMLESAGIEFDAVWLGNQNQGVWPPDTKRNPFIPAAAQVAAGYPHADHAGNLAWAASALERLRRQCGEMVMSRPAQDGDVSLQCGSFMQDPPTRSAAPETLIQRLHPPGDYMQEYNDDHGTAYPDGMVAGGVGLISSQSACPFQAYARYRLKARWDDLRGAGLDALDRGTLVHELMEKLWEGMGDSATLKLLDESARNELIRKAVAAALEKYLPRGGMGEAYQLSTESWLGKLAADWLELERTRSADFEVVAHELETSLELSGLELVFRIDRIDRLADGRLVLIDYKTGAGIPAPRWLGKPPHYRSEYPQLGLYALAVQQSQDAELKGEIDGLLTAIIRPGESRFTGFTVQAAFQDTRAGKPPRKLEDVKMSDDQHWSWPELVEHWRNNFSQRAGEFRDGLAVVDPIDNACRYCDLPTLCRIDELNRRAGDDDGGDDG